MSVSFPAAIEVALHTLRLQQLLNRLALSVLSSERSRLGRD